MSLVQSLRDFISQRLTSAIDEIFSEVEKTIVQYEEVIDRQRRLLDVTWKPEIRLTRVDLPEEHVLNEKEVQTDHRISVQEKRTSLDQEGPGHRRIKLEQVEPEPPRVEPGPPQVEPGPPRVEPGPPRVEPGPPRVKDKQEKLCSSRQLLNQELYNFLVRSSYEESGHAEPEPNIYQLLPHSSAVTATPDQEGGMQVDSNAEMPVTGLPHNLSFSNDSSSAPETLFNNNIFGTPLKCKFKHPKYQRNAMEHFCPRCGKGFRKMENMLLHLKTHTGDYVFTCYLCGRGFVHRSGLICHMRIHTSDRPHSCELCGKSFTARVALMCHMKTHAANGANPCKLW